MSYVVLDKLIGMLLNAAFSLSAATWIGDVAVFALSWLRGRVIGLKK